LSKKLSKTSCSTFLFSPNMLYLKSILFLLNKNKIIVKTEEMTLDFISNLIKIFWSISFTVSNSKNKFKTNPTNVTVINNNTKKILFFIL
jgi:hypothetical protein